MSMSSSAQYNATGKNQPTDKSLSASRVVINTRPVERAASLTNHLQTAGLTVVEMPMLTLQSRSTTDNDMALMRQWLTGSYKALVIVSPTAAASGLAIWQSLAHQLKAKANTDKQAQTDLEALEIPSPIIAVGEATAAVLNHAKLNTANYQIRQPEIANNEGMLAMPEIESLQAGDKILIWRGLGGRRLLVDALQARGVHIDSIAWYERTMPINAATQYRQWLQAFLTYKAMQDSTPLEQSKPIVVVSSGTAFEHWATIVKEVRAETLQAQSDDLSASAMDSPMGLTLSDFTYIVLGERLANLVAEQQLSYWRVDDLAPETILAAISS